MKYSATILKRFLDIYEMSFTFLLFLLLVENKSEEQFVNWQVKRVVHLLCFFFTAVLEGKKKNSLHWYKIQIQK